MIFDNTIAINEEAIFTKNNKNPVYIVLSSGNSLFAKGIKAVTKSEFSHAMISFNSKLDPLYSFGTKEDGKRLGFVINNPKDHVFDIDEVKYSVYVMYVTDKAKKAMTDALQFFIDNKDKLRYDFHGIADIWRGKTSDQRSNKWFCSRFVMYLISKATELSKSPSLWRPSDIADLDNISLVNRGFNFYNYDYKVTEKHCNNIKNGKYNIGDVLYEETNSSSSTVFFTKDISTESLVHIYHALRHPMRGNVGIKISTGEYGGNNYLKPELIKDLVEEVNGTIIECNTAYNGSRNTFKSHKDTIKKHGFTKITNVDLMDETGNLSIPVKNGYHLKENILGKSITNYNSIIMLSHFKGHMMAGYGGALKNMSIGMASAKGKINIHTAGKGGDMMKADRNEFLESMVDADSSVMDFMDPDNIIYINVANNLSVDCDCDPHPHKPEIADIGIFASLDPVAVDQACIDAIYNLKDPKKKSLIQRIESRNGLHILECAEEKKLGSRKYNLVNIDMDNRNIVYGTIIKESRQSEAIKYFNNGSEYYLEKEYERVYKPYHYKVPAVGFPTNNRTEYLEVVDAAKLAARSYYKFKVEDANTDYPFKFYNILNISKEKYMKLINGNVPINKRYDANLYHINIRDDHKRISVILLAIPGTIYSMYLLLPNDVLYKFNYEGTMYQEAAYCHEDYRESAIMATNKLNQLHDNYQMMNITTRDIELEDGKWIFAEYIIDNDIDKGNVIRFTNFINKIIETSIYEGCIESPCEYRPTGILAISEKSIYDICTEDIKYYQNPAKQLQIKNTKKKNSKIKTGNYSALQIPVPKTTTNDKTVEEQVIEDLEKIAEDARRLLTREIFNCKDCAYVYKDIMLPYTRNTFAIIGWDLNRLKDRDKLSFPNCRDAVFGYCKNKFNHTHPGYCLDFDNNCFYIYKK